MERREKVVKSGRTDEVLVDAEVVAVLRVSKVKIKVNNIRRRNSSFFADKVNQPRIMLTKNLSLFRIFFLDQVCMNIRGENRPQFNLRVGLELVSFCSQMNGQVWNFKYGFFGFP